MHGLEEDKQLGRASNVSCYQLHQTGIQLFKTEGIVKDMSRKTYLDNSQVFNSTSHVD